MLVFQISLPNIVLAVDIPGVREARAVSNEDTRKGREPGQQAINKGTGHLPQQKGDKSREATGKQKSNKAHLDQQSTTPNTRASPSRFEACCLLGRPLGLYREARSECVHCNNMRNAIIRALYIKPSPGELCA